MSLSNVAIANSELVRTLLAEHVNAENFNLTDVTSYVPSLL